MFSSIFKKSFILVLISLSLAATELLAQESEDIPNAESILDNHGLPVDSEIPNLTSQSLSGNEINLANFRGNYLLIDFWGSWCKPCYDKIPYLTDAYAKYGHDVTFIGVAVDDKEDKVKEFIDSYSVEWPQILVSSESDWVQEFNVMLFPTSFLISPEGNILVGANSGDQISSMRGENLMKTLDKFVSKP